MTDFWLLVFRALPELGGQLNEWPQIFRKRPFCWFRLNFCSWPIVRIPTPCPIAAVAFSGWLVWRLNPDRLFPAICRPWPLILSGHPEDWFALKPAGQPTEVPRPKLTLALRLESGSNMAVTCRSAINCLERQFPYPTNSNSRPNSDLHNFGLAMTGFALLLLFRAIAECELLGQK